MPVIEMVVDCALVEKFRPVLTDEEREKLELLLEYASEGKTSHEYARDVLDCHDEAKTANAIQLETKRILTAPAKAIAAIRSKETNTEVVVELKWPAFGRKGKGGRKGKATNMRIGNAMAEMLFKLA